ncbi:MAG: rhodanese-like domain-containing protein [Oscillospiraceae bacterium]
MRTPQEYREGHIPGSRNIPWWMRWKSDGCRQTGTPLFVYCLSGARSGSQRRRSCGAWAIAM